MGCLLGLFFCLCHLCLNSLIVISFFLWNSFIYKYKGWCCFNQRKITSFFHTDEYSSLGVIAWGGYSHFGLSYKCNRNGCFETIMNCHWKPEKLQNLGLKRMNLIKSCYQVTSCLNTRAPKVRDVIKRANQQHHIYLEVKFRSNPHSSKVEKKKGGVCILTCYSINRKIKSQMCHQFGKSWKMLDFLQYISPSRYLFQDWKIGFL